MFHCGIVVIYLFLQLCCAVSNEAKAETANALNVTITENNSTTLLPPVAEALVRYRRQPTRTIVKHIVRPKRMKIKRVKRPKIKYSFAEPPPTYYRNKPSYNRHKAPTLDSLMFEDFSHYNVESTGFSLPPSSYEAQSMDLDLYKNYEAPSEYSYKEIPKTSSFEYAGPEDSYKEPNIQESPSYLYTSRDVSFKEPEILYKEIQRPQTYSYAEPEVSYKTQNGHYNKPENTYSYIPPKNTEISLIRKPHTKYGVPTEFVYSTDYDKHSSNKYSYEPPPSFKPSKPIFEEIEKPSNEEYSYITPGKDEYSFSIPKDPHPLRIPATKYGVPDTYIPAAGTNDYNKYSVVEQKPSYASHTPTKPGKYNFAEPPQPEQNVEITYSPSYEIHIPPSHENTHSSGNHNVEHHSPPPSYEEPTQEYHPQPPSYENPKQQYDTSSNYQPSSHYPQQHPGYQESSDTNQPPTYHSPPASHGSVSEYIPQSHDLPIDVHHKQPSYGYPKSSYEVPIYDPLPFDPSNYQDQEIYPPQTHDHSHRQQNSHVEYVAEANNVSEQRPSLQHQPESEETTAGDAQSSGTRPLPQATSQKTKSPITRLRKTRKRKRNKGSSTTVSNKKHILDVPELEQAFEDDQRNQIQNDDIDANESHKIQNININSGSWNPMKTRTSPITVTTQSTTLTINNLSTKSKRYQYKQRSTTTTTTAKPPKQEIIGPKVKIISFEKSRSKSYYDGILSTPRIYNTNIFRNRSKVENPPTTSAPTQMMATNEKKFFKRTTKNVFDTTGFKSPLTDGDLNLNLPKNHKLF